MEYKEYKLKDITEINSENIDKNYDGKYINYLDTSNITNGKIDNLQYINIGDAPSRAKRIVKINDIIYSTVRPNLCHYGILRKLEKNMIVSTGFVVLRCKKEINPEYLYAYLTLSKITKQMQSIAETTTSTYPSIRPSDIGDLIIPIPSIELQNKISHILLSIELKLGLNNKINDNLQKLSSEVYKRWFIDFEFPNKDGKPYKHFDGKMINSELGEIPEDWKINVLGEFLNIKYGKNLPTSKITNVGYPVYGGNGVIGKYKEFLYKEPQILISCRGAASGKVIISEYNSFITNNSLILETERIKYFYIKELSLNKNYYGYTTGSAQPQITIDNIKNIKLLVPPESILKDFNNIVSKLESKCFKIKYENEKLTQLRDTLLPKLMNGEIDLDNIEIY